MKKHFLIGLLALMTLAAAPGTSMGGSKEDQDLARSALLRGEVLPLTRILDITARHVPGEVVKLELESKKKRLYYEIKILTPSGRLRELYLDARTGAFIAIEDE
ncbi:PepSY domain-containing protein [Govanella unica]|uniref:PepSY domain-containing protein n=1 Tax=Govanella unica TaxID=2975056 RepID=A0A9X3TXQ5_9PROT|nr:PepSY domain-containing protein [Govania unica]MDA5193911.1 PepSY domain-containing protein [Govania unica]